MDCQDEEGGGEEELRKQELEPPSEAGKQSLYLQMLVVETYVLPASGVDSEVSVTYCTKCGRPATGSSLDCSYCDAHAPIERDAASAKSWALQQAKLHKTRLANKLLQPWPTFLPAPRRSSAPARVEEDAGAQGRSCDEDDRDRYIHFEEEKEQVEGAGDSSSSSLGIPASQAVYMDLGDDVPVQDLVSIGLSGAQMEPMLDQPAHSTAQLDENQVQSSKPIATSATSPADSATSTVTNTAAGTTECNMSLNEKYLTSPAPVEKTNALLRSYSKTGHDGTQSIARVHFSACKLTRRVMLDVCLDAYKDVNAREMPMLAVLVCDGCGASRSSGEPYHLANNIEVYAAKLTTPSPVCAVPNSGLLESTNDGTSDMFRCLDRSCQNVLLCKFCKVMGHWQSTTHSHAHALELENCASPTASSNEQTLRQGKLYGGFDDLTLHIGSDDTPAYCDTKKNLLVFTKRLLHASVIINSA
jgi:hypothetical protein